MQLSNLRQSAINALRNESVDAAEFQNQSLQELIHELRVRQVELEMQNEELRLTGRLCVRAGTGSYFHCGKAFSNGVSSRDPA